MRKDRKELYLFAIFLVVPVIWLALLFAPYIENGLISSIGYLDDALDHPFSIRLCSASVKTVITFVSIYLLGAAMVFSSLKNTRRKEEYGSARWGNVKSICSKYKNDDYFDNKLLS